MTNATPQRILVIHGPNLNLLGKRDPTLYGSETLEQINARLAAIGHDLGFDVVCKQSNIEGDIVELVHSARGAFGGIVINPAGYSHTSVVIRDALLAVGIPAVEVHLSNLYAREEFRRVSLTGAVTRGVVSGFKSGSYEWGLRALIQIIEGK
ncbi:MAG: type II 3-dehydroquinate dehydratase [Deltaproteobacteria bacterium]|nr:type II 3-dehydroquinate dehydratase [Deltaproteobacteria bacterium]